jgi:hypothetical protein
MTTYCETCIRELEPDEAVRLSKRKLITGHRGSQVLLPGKVQTFCPEHAPSGPEWDRIDAGEDQ